MSTRYTKTLTIDEPLTKKQLQKMLVEYKPEGVKDWIVTAFCTTAAKELLKKGRLAEMGTYAITVWYDIKRPLHFKFNCKKIA